MEKITWIKKNGNELETNDTKASIEYMESIGAKRKGSKKKAKPVEKESKE